MSEVTKLYENAGIKPYIYCSKPQLDCDARETGNCKQDCEYYSGERSLAPFTVEKQLELIKWLIQKNFYDERIIRSNYEKTHFYCSYMYDYCESEYFEKFEEALANVFNYFWQDLTEQEITEIRSILNG